MDRLVSAGLAIRGRPGRHIVVRLDFFVEGFEEEGLSVGKMTKERVEKTEGYCGCSHDNIRGMIGSSWTLAAHDTDYINC